MLPERRLSPATFTERFSQYRTIPASPPRLVGHSWDTGRPFESGGVIKSAWLQPLFGAGSTAASSLRAGNVFLATANPATLMTTGVGSAVMGPAGIVAHAPSLHATRETPPTPVTHPPFSRRPARTPRRSSNA